VITGNLVDNWKTLGRETVYQAGKYLTVESHKIELTDGTIIPDWSWVITPDFVNVLAITAEQKILCFRQTKYALDGLSLAPVGGYLDAGEDGLTAAKRELLEETGYHSDNWIPLGQYVQDANRGVATAHLFLAIDAIQTAEPTNDDLEEMELLTINQEQLQEAVFTGQFKVGTWATTAALALLHLTQKEQ